MINNYAANGKILLTGEYAVLDGALALGIPTKLGQKLNVKQTSTEEIIWTAFLPKQKLWFYAQLGLYDLNVLKTNNQALAKSLSKILNELKILNQSFFETFSGLEINTFLDFEKDWGLGSSSTLISLLAQWARVNPYELLSKTFGGSGYDLACATTEKPVFFRLSNDKKAPYIKKVDFIPKFHKHLFFIYLNQKQNSREGIKTYKNQVYSSSFIEQISQISEQITKVEDLKSFEELIIQHEELVSNQIKLPRVSETLFPDYEEGIIKSLGAWGGDFILATSQNIETDYFKKKGYDIIFPYIDFVK